MEVTPVPILGRLVQVVILGNELLQLGLHVDDFLGWELELADGDTGGFEMCKETDFGRLEKHEGAAFGICSGGAADAVDVVSGVVRRVVLDDPVDCGDLPTR